ncbi:hypothetical protein ABXT00_13770 [Stenotrophomonas koreensis]|uniref:hypothetical protein n=1 Tax=Stenotrophomonas koreensis TaxID=266128 RepID=UPI0033987D6A
MTFSVEKIPGLRWKIRLALLFIGLFLLVFFAWGSRDELSRMVAHSDVRLVVISVFLGVLFTFIQALLFATLVRKYDAELNNLNLASAYLLSQPGKYIPGKVWSLAMQSLSIDRSVRVSNIAVANVELAAVSVVQMIVMGGALIFVGSPMIVSIFLIGGLVFCTIVSAFPLAATLKLIVPKLSSVIGLMAPPPTLGCSGLLKMAGLNAASMLLNFAASMSVLSSVGSSLEVVDFPRILSSIYLASGAGVFIFPVPAGLGVREAFAAGLASMLSPELSAPLIVSITLLFRCWQIPVDVLCTLLGALLARRRKFEFIKK